MTSDNDKEAFGWIWLPEKTQPVVAGWLEADNATSPRVSVSVIMIVDMKNSKKQDLTPSLSSFHASRRTFSPSSVTRPMR